MSVRIRLKRMGSKRNAFYRFVVADSRRSRDGSIIDNLGYYDPLTEPENVKIEEEKALEWLAKGAKPSNTVKSLFKKAGIMEKFNNARQ